MKGPGVLVSPDHVDATVDVERTDVAWTLDTLYRAHATDVARWATRLAGPELDVEDIVHEVFLIVQSRLGAFRGEGKITTWLFRITHNVARQERRRARWSRWWRSDEGLEFADERDGPDTIAERRSDVRRLYRALEGMSEKLRTVLILHDIDGRTAPEIAELLDITPNTVWVRLHRAKKDLVTRLQRSAR